MDLVSALADTLASDADSGIDLVTLLCPHVYEAPRPFFDMFSSLKVGWIRWLDLEQALGNHRHVLGFKNWGSKSFYTNVQKVGGGF